VLRWQVGEEEKYAGRVGKMEYYPKDEPAIHLTSHGHGPSMLPPMFLLR